MSEYQVKAPVAFIVFNRAETTKKVFAEIKAAKPERLLIVADGPRSDRPEESDLCRQVREIAKKIDWDCEFLENCADHNMGCKERVSSGLDWVFEQVDEAIILEDDCLPHPTFFRFCDEMLAKYRDDQRIGHIGGVNFQFNRNHSGNSYYYSRYNHVWGWASWASRWQDYDVDITLWPDLRDNGWLDKVLGSSQEVDYWHSIFQSVYEGSVDTWDYQWTFACWAKSWLSIIPSVNLVSNLGFDNNATHTKGSSKFSKIILKKMDFPLISPIGIVRDIKSDNYTNKIMFKPPIRSWVKAKAMGWLS